MPSPPSPTMSNAAVMLMLNNASIRLNNIGASLLELRNYRAAIATLSDTVELLTRQGQQQQQQRGGGEYAAVVTFARILERRAESRLTDASAASIGGGSATTTTTTSRTKDIFAVCGSTGAFLVQTEPMILRQQQSVDEPPPPYPVAEKLKNVLFVAPQPHQEEIPTTTTNHRRREAEKISAAVLHNLGLSFHLLACTSAYDDAPPSLRDDLLDRRALAFYEMSMEVALRIIDEGSEDLDAGDVLLWRLALSYLNNTGQILFEYRGDRDGGRQRFRDLKAMLWARRRTNGGSGSGSGSCGYSDEVYAFNTLVAEQLNAAEMA